MSMKVIATVMAVLFGLAAAADVTSSGFERNSAFTNGMKIEGLFKPYSDTQVVRAILKVDLNQQITYESEGFMFNTGGTVTEDIEMARFKAEVFVTPISHNSGSMFNGTVELQMFEDPKNTLLSDRDLTCKMELDDTHLASLSLYIKLAEGDTTLAELEGPNGNALEMLNLDGCDKAVADAYK